jgi:hypothetical protein
LDLDALHGLLERGDGRDRAFVDGVIRIRWSRADDAAERTDLERLHHRLREVSVRTHGALRAQIASRTLHGAALREHFDRVPMLERDHYVEEALGIAYPRLDEPVLGAELTPYTPSGYDEIVHALDVTGLGPGDRFIDLGSGAGKAVMLAELLATATSTGIECDGALHALAEAASGELGLRAWFLHADVRDVAIEDAEVVFMYLPFTGSVLSTVMSRLIVMGQRREPGARRFVCSGTLDARRHAELVEAGSPRSWLRVYAFR